MSSKISYSDFEKLDIRVGKILQVDNHPNASKLYILKVDLSEEKPRQIVAGLKPYYKPSELLNKKAIFITNLEPKIIKGVESNGMILAADNSEGKVIFIAPENNIDVGSKIR